MSRYTLAEVPCGTSVVELLPRLLSSMPEVLAVSLAEVTTPPSMEHRPGAGPELLALAKLARAQQKKGESFTEILLTLAAERGLSDEALNVALFHQPLSAAPKVHSIAIDAFTPHELRSIASGVPADRTLVFTSDVLTLGGTRHVPMIDFKLAAAAENLGAAMAAAKRLGSGCVLESGSSYHYYGARLVTTEALREWLLRAQLLSRYVDTRWVTHQLIEGRCALRVSPRVGGTGTPPHVVGHVFDDHTDED